MQDWTAEFNRAYLEYFKQRHSRTSTLHKAMLYAIEGPGKRLRPLLAHEASLQTKLSPEVARLFGFAIESIHLFSLIHDDLPCLDNDDLRRGIPTVHKAFSEANALLAGDALLNFAYEIWGELSSRVDPPFFIAAFKLFSASVHEMIQGQSLELELKSESSLEDLLKVQDSKTGALFRAALGCPILLSGIHEFERTYLDTIDFASALGFAYQILDDLDDESQDRAAEKNILSLLGKAEAIRQVKSRLFNNPLHRQYSITEWISRKL